MKLNEYIWKKLVDALEGRDKEIKEPISENWIEELIVDWYKETYNRMPPTWLAIDSSKHELLDALKKELKE